MKPKSSRSKPARKSRSEFQLSRHPKGLWCKNVKQPDGKWKMFYFGRIEGDEDGQAAIKEWLRVKDDLLAGRTPRPKDDTRVTIKTLANAFLNGKRGAFESQEITWRTLDEHIATCERLARVFGSGRAVEDLTAEDFEQLRADVARTMGAGSVGQRDPAGSFRFRLRLGSRYLGQARPVWPGLPETEPARFAGGTGQAAGQDVRGCRDPFHSGRGVRPGESDGFVGLLCGIRQSRLRGAAVGHRTRGNPNRLVGLGAAEIGNW
jgi:hypothetical protein